MCQLLTETARQHSQWPVGPCFCTVRAHGSRNCGACAYSQAMRWRERSKRKADVAVTFATMFFFFFTFREVLEKAWRHTEDVHAKLTTKLHHFLANNSNNNKMTDTIESNRSCSKHLGGGWRRSEGITRISYAIKKKIHRPCFPLSSSPPWT